VRTAGRPPFDREQYAASIGGPIKRDRAWFFATFEYRNQDGVVITEVRDLTAGRVVTSFSPVPLNDFLFTGRGDWQTGENDRMAFRFSAQREDDVDRGSLRRPIGTADNRQHSFNKYYSFVYRGIQPFNVTNVRGVNNVNFSGFQNTLLRDSANSADAGFLRSSRFGSAIQTAGGVFGTGHARFNLPYASITEGGTDISCLPVPFIYKS